MPYLLLRKLERLQSMLPAKGSNPNTELIRSPLQLDDEMLRIIEDIEKLAKNAYGQDLPPQRQADILASKGFPVIYTRLEGIIGNIPSILTKHGKICYR